jgi:hypothetical protein
VVPIAHGSLVVTHWVQLKRARFRENGFIEGKKTVSIMFRGWLQRRDIELGISTELRGGDSSRHFRDMRQGLGQESACQEGAARYTIGRPIPLTTSSCDSAVIERTRRRA